MDENSRLKSLEKNSNVNQAAEAKWFNFGFGVLVAIALNVWLIGWAFKYSGNPLVVFALVPGFLACIAVWHQKGPQVWGSILVQAVGYHSIYVAVKTSEQEIALWAIFYVVGLMLLIRYSPVDFDAMEPFGVAIVASILIGLVTYGIQKTYEPKLIHGILLISVLTGLWDFRKQVLEFWKS